jgi:hypothetical protein
MLKSAGAEWTISRMQIQVLTSKAAALLRGS